MASVSELGSTLGIPIKTNKYTMEKTRLSYARLLIDIPVEGSFPEFIDFVNNQDLVYEWKPIKCNHCKMFGHLEEECRKKARTRREWREAQNQSDVLRGEGTTQPQGAINDTIIQNPRHDTEEFITVRRPLTRMFHSPKRESDTIRVQNPFEPLHKEALQTTYKRRPPLLMDRICSWNIRGLNWPNKQKDVKIFLQERNIGIIGLFETKVKEKNIEMVATKLFQGWHWQHNFHLNTKWRIWVAWRPRHYNVQIISMEEQFIHYRAMHTTTMKSVYLTFIYGANQEGQRRALWEALKNIAKDMEEAWCILGDFNSVLYPRDRMGGIDI
ncbi:LOW QUALITY PROTEIN: hypothetical protein Cgig2_020785 [Carnegiea gigantea]|uniref:Endonuclease/exonuclease/phosphatase domain-containing protein n=1 Tax=Carnegiea gigantea TaxID=171969 RepID=A0A9Q1JIM3_9CARY|nr:LOW QUALITY PROTEIN: hypothetical protein Cgig2_020785 [Carnegiea gigantea]